MTENHCHAKSMVVLKTNKTEGALPFFSFGPPEDSILLGSNYRFFPIPQYTSKRGRGELDVIWVDSKDEKNLPYNPTQKSVECLRWVIRHFTPSPGTLVLDACGGTGTTSIAAALEGYSSIYIDSNGTQWTGATRRVTQLQKYAALQIQVLRKAGLFGGTASQAQNEYDGADLSQAQALAEPNADKTTGLVTDNVERIIER